MKHLDFVIIHIKYMIFFKNILLVILYILKYMLYMKSSDEKEKLFFYNEHVVSLLCVASLE